VLPHALVQLRRMTAVTRNATRGLGNKRFSCLVVQLALSKAFAQLHTTSSQEV
jgi:hypothetical protein